MRKEVFPYVKPREANRVKAHAGPREQVPLRFDPMLLKSESRVLATMLATMGLVCSPECHTEQLESRHILARDSCSPLQGDQDQHQRQQRAGYHRPKFDLKKNKVHPHTRVWLCPCACVHVSALPSPSPSPSPALHDANAPLQRLPRGDQRSPAPPVRMRGAQYRGGSIGGVLPPRRRATSPPPRAHFLL